MARRCDVCFRGTSANLQVSHAHNRSLRKIFINLQEVRAIVKGRMIRIRACTKCLKSGKVKKAA